MKRKIAIFILIVVIALTLFTFVGCDNRPHAYLIEGVYECENISCGEMTIDKIVVGVKEVASSEFDRYDPHMVECAEKTYYIDFDIWIDGEKREADYIASYDYKARSFYTQIIDDDNNLIHLDYTTKNENDSYYLSAFIYMYNRREYWQKREEAYESDEDVKFEDLVNISDEIILKKIN